MLAPSDTPARLSLEKSAVEKGLLRVALLFRPIASFAPVTPFLLLCNISFLNLLGLLTQTFSSQITRSPLVGLVLVADAPQRKRRAGGARRGAGGMSQEPRPSGSREAHGSGGRVSGFARNGTARHARKWRVLAGFWRKKAGAGCVPSLISACAAADARRGYFLHCLRGVRARSERPLDSDAPSPPTPFFAQPEGAGGIPSDGISKKAVLDGARWINGGPLMQVSLRVGRAASMRRVGSASGVAC